MWEAEHKSTSGTIQPIHTAIISWKTSASSLYVQLSLLSTHNICVVGYIVWRGGLCVVLRSRQASHSIVSAAALNQRKNGAQRCAMFARHFFFPSPFLVLSFVSNIYLCQESIVYYSMFVVVMRSIRKKRHSNDLRFLPEVEVLFPGWFSCTCTPSEIVLWQPFSFSTLSLQTFMQFVLFFLQDRIRDFSYINDVLTL